MPKEKELRKIQNVVQEMDRYYQSGQFGKSIEPATRLCELVCRYFGEEHAEYRRALSNLGMIYENTGNYSSAEPLFRKAMDISRKVYGENHPDFADSLESVAVMEQKLGRPMAAEPLYKQVIEIRLRALGKNHPLYSAALNNLGELYREMGNYTAAEPLQSQALEIAHKIYGKNHPDYSISLNNMALVHYSAGRYSVAEPLLKEVVEIRRRILGESHPLYINALNNLGELYQEMGSYKTAESLLRKALELRRVILGVSHPDFAQSLNNLAAFHSELGNIFEAEMLFREAREIWHQSLGEQHPLYATSINNLGEMYLLLERFSEAEECFSKAVKIREQSLGRKHPELAAGLHNMAKLFHTKKDFKQAEAYFKKAFQAWPQDAGEDHASFATLTASLSHLYFEQGEYGRAEPLARKASEIYKRIMGDNHFLYASSLVSIALVCAATQRLAEAFQLMKEVMDIDDRIIAQVFSIGSERKRLRFLESIQGKFGIFLSLLSAHFVTSQDAVQTAMDLIFRRKAIGAEVLGVQRDMMLRGAYPELRPKLDQLNTLNSQIAQRSLAGPGAEGLAVHQRLLAGWYAQKEQLEAELASQIPEMSLEAKLMAADTRAISRVIAQGSILIEYVRHSFFDFKAVPARGESLLKPDRYLAFILPSGRPRDVKCIDLGEADVIDKKIAKFRSSLLGGLGDQGERGLGAVLERSEGEADRLGRELHDVIFKPLVEKLEGCKDIILAPDADVTRLPFEVLPTDAGNRLIDDHHIRYVSTGRDILRFGTSSSGSQGQSLIAADPDFELSLGGQHRSEDEEPGQRLSRDLAPGKVFFPRLPATDEEGRHIASLLKVEPLLGASAVESRLKASRSPYILHLATHGFFLENQDDPPDKGQRGLGSLGFEPGETGKFSGSKLENPLLRSGLALAGANTWIRGDRLPGEAEDGILTALDVTGLDLLNTELVVLSACETGLGEVRTGEGVFGLRRAFVLAGAKSLVMSLWKVPDQQTQELMKEFYLRVMDGEDKAEALRQAQLTIKARYPDPIYWGAFIFQGEPGSLRPV